MADPTRFFKGWAKPGPLAPGRDFLEFQPDAGETMDAISGDFRLFQLAQGHRFSTDDLLTAYYGATWCPRAETVLDLGSGIGSVGMIAAWRLPGARFITIEAQEESVRLARKSARYNGLETRYEIRLGDFRDPRILSDEEKFDLILGSPPYFPLTAGVHGDHPQKIACRFELRGTITDYCQIAAAHLNWGGIFACIFPVNPPEQMARILSAAQSHHLTVVRWRPVVFREPEPPLLGVFAMTRSDHLPDWFRHQTWQEPPLIIRAQSGQVHPEYMALKLSIGFPP
jgi:tRNA1Val (adenine37-N6)-methyltransferase